MKRFMGKIKTERSLMDLAKKLKAFLVQDVRGMASEVLAISVNVQDGIKGGSLALETDPMIEAGPGGVIVSHMPFADKGRAVTVFLQGLRKSR
jgi:hypothetical protein